MSDKGTEIRKISIKEFREQGYLQELNRNFLHPLGLALEVAIDDETGEEKLGGVWDYRDDPEGMNYGPDMIDPQKTKRVMEELVAKRSTRLSTLGYVVQPATTGGA